MSDLISRQTAIDALDKRFDDVPMELTTEILQLRHDLRERIPSAQPATSCSEIPNSSDDTISRQAAIYAIVNTPSKVGYHDNSEVARYGATFRQHEILDIIEGMPPAQPEPHWIPCSERLPDVGSGIIFCDVDGDIFVGHRASEHWWSVDDKVKNVVAWMPLPEPYKGGEKGIAGALAGGDA